MKVKICNGKVIEAKAQQVKSAIGGVPIAEVKWAAQSHALSARPRAKRPGKFLKFEFLNLRGNQGMLPLVRLAATCALSVHVINSGEFFETPQPLSCLQGGFLI